MDGLAWPSGDTTASRLEAALVRHYLSTESGSGAAPLTFIDASASSLREALECEDDASALDALVRGCGGPESVAHVLAYGWQRQWNHPGTPGYFRYLVLTCAVVASADDNLDSRDFGVNLQRLLRTDRTFRRAPE